MRSFVAAAMAILSCVGANASAQAIDGAGVYKDACASCHDQPTGRIPSKDSLKDRTPEAILNALNSGTMTMQAVQLSAAERRAVSEHLAGKPFGSIVSTDTGMCTAKPAPLANVAALASWNGFGVDSSNSRYSQNQA